MSGINMSRFFVGVVGECRIVMPNDPGEHLSSDEHVITEKPEAAKLEADPQLHQARRRTFKLVFSRPLRGGEFKKARSQTPLKTLTHTQWLRDAEHKGQALTRPRVWKGQNLCAIWKRGSVIPACQYDFIRSFSSRFQPPNSVCWIIDRGRLMAGLWRPSRSCESRKKEELPCGRWVQPRVQSEVSLHVLIHGGLNAPSRELKLRIQSIRIWGWISNQSGSDSEMILVSQSPSGRYVWMLLATLHHMWLSSDNRTMEANTFRMCILLFLPSIWCH